MTEPRVPMLSIEEAEAAAEAAGISSYVARLNIFRVLLQHPALAKVLNDLLMRLLGEGRLDPRLRELVIMRIGWETGSNYEWTQHWRVARSLGVPDDDLLAVRDWPRSDRFGAVERAVLAATDEVLEGGRIRPSTWAACEDHLRDREVMLELIAVIGTWRMVSSILRSLDVPLEDGVEPWPPDGARA